mmetsp:Transcript_31181/g.30719  ORF Transcript_31181/g.30719 Transcript_31181/m.30719 type:complete len:209 (+) Transcript_31181:22-648(+)
MMSNYDSKAQYPEIEAPSMPKTVFPGVPYHARGVIQKEQKYGELHDEKEAMRPLESQPSNMSAPPMLEKKSSDNFSLGVVRSDVGSQPASSETRAAPELCDPTTIQVTDAVPISTTTELNGIKILPQYSSMTPVFTPPEFDKKRKKFYHPFFHAEADKYHGPRGCKICSGSGYSTKDNSPCSRCFSYLCNVCWNTGIDIKKKKECKNK